MLDQCCLCLLLSIQQLQHHLQQQDPATGSAGAAAPAPMHSNNSNSRPTPVEQQQVSSSSHAGGRANQPNVARRLLPEEGLDATAAAAAAMARLPAAAAAAAVQATEEDMDVLQQSTKKARPGTHTPTPYQHFLYGPPPASSGQQFGPVHNPGVNPLMAHGTGSMPGPPQQVGCDASGFACDTEEGKRARVALKESTYKAEHRWLDWLLACGILGAWFYMQAASHSGAYSVNLQKGRP